MDIAELARIGLPFIDGDDLEGALIDKIGPTDYDFDKFNRLKRVLLKIERIAPELDACAILWVKYSRESEVVIPAIAGSSLTPEGSKRSIGNKTILGVFAGGNPTVYQRENGLSSYYAPVPNSNGRIVGVLELIVGLVDRIDVSYRDMYNPRRLDNYVEPEVL